VTNHYIRSVQFLLSDQKTTYFTKIIGPDTKTTALVPNDENISVIFFNRDFYRHFSRLVEVFYKRRQPVSKVWWKWRKLESIKFKMTDNYSGLEASYSGYTLLRLSFIISAVKYYDSREASCLPGWVFNSGSCYFKPQMQLNFTDSRK